MYIWVEKRESEMAEMHAYEADCAVFLYNLCLSASFYPIKIFPGLYNFPDTLTILEVTPPAYALPPV